MYVSKLKPPRSLLDLALPAFLGLNPDQACLDLSLPAHNQGAGEGRGGGAAGERRDGWWEERRGRRESDPDGDPHVHSTVYILGQQADLAGSQYTGWKTDGEEDMRQGRERPDVNKGLDRERESSTICVLKVSTFENKCDYEWD